MTRPTPLPPPRDFGAAQYNALCAERGVDGVELLQRRAEGLRSVPDVALRDWLAFELRKRYGWSYPELAAAMGWWSHSAAMEAVRREENRRMTK